MKSLVVKIATSLFTIIIAQSAHAGLIGSTTGTNITERSCSDVDSNYIETWRSTIESMPNRLPGGATYANACIFNSQMQAWFEDPTTSNGSRTSYQNVQNGVSQAFLQNNDGDIWLSAELDLDNLALPEAHFLVQSDALERNSANLFSAQAFQWEGEATTLEYTALFDFSLSGGMWHDSVDSFYALSFGASKNMRLEDGWLFPADFGLELAQSSYDSREDDELQAGVVAEREITISFDVSDGDIFYLWGLSQAFGLNGGWVDSQNSLHTRLGISGLDQQQSQQVLTNALQALTSVPEPGTWVLLVSSLAMVARRRK